MPLICAIINGIWYLIHAFLVLAIAQIWNTLDEYEALQKELAEALKGSSISDNELISILYQIPFTIAQIKEYFFKKN